MGNQLEQLRVQAIELRRAGKSRREIKELLQITSNHVLNEALRGEPPPDWTGRPKAKDDLRARARELRRQGLVYNEIAAKLGVSKSSVSLWVRNIPRSETLSYEESRARQAAGVSAYWDAERKRREQSRAAVSEAAADQIGLLSDREILIAGAVAYWCEGAKNKPYRRSDRIDFINSDPQLVKLFLRFLETAGVSRDRLIFKVSIHETADPVAAQQFWRKVIGFEDVNFKPPLIKRHKPLTVRKNTGDDYHGCLRILVRRSIGLYRQIEGWASAVMMSPATSTEPARTDDLACLAPVEMLKSGIELTPYLTELPGEDSNLG
jgi:transcriptional regulator with XRE-family HTH domain